MKTVWLVVDPDNYNDQSTEPDGNVVMGGALTQEDAAAYLERYLRDAGLAGEDHDVGLIGIDVLEPHEEYPQP